MITTRSILFSCLTLLLLTGTVHAKRIQTKASHGDAMRVRTASGTNLFSGTYGGGIWGKPLSQTTPLTQDWTSQSVGVWVNLKAVKAVSASVAWACGGFGTVLRTTNGGGTWTIVSSPDSTLICFSIDAFDANMACIVASNSLGGNTALYKTTNGGSTWTRQLASTASGSYYNAVRFYDANNGIMIGDPEDGYFVVCTTTDGGTTWTRTPQSSIPAPVSGECGLTNNLAVFGNNAWFGTQLGATRVFHSADRGRTWTVSAPITGLGNALLSTSFADDTVGLALGYNGRVAQTRDGGNSWSNAITAGAYQAGAVTFVTAAIAIVVSASTSSFSADTGNTWTRLAYFGSDELTAISFASSSTGWAVGGTTILKWNGGNLGGVPSVVTNAASNVVSTSAIVSATVRPSGLSTTVHFEWGTSSSLPSFSTTRPLSIGSGASEVSVSDTLKGLSANSTYYYRAVAQNSAGTQKGAIVGFTTTPTLVEQVSNEVPTEYCLSQSFPNPFNPTTTIEFALPRSEPVTLKLFNLVGEEIETLASERLSAGRYQVQWNASGNTSGVYFYRLVAGSYVETKKMVLLR